MTSSSITIEFERGLPRSLKAERAVLPLDMAAYHAVRDYHDPVRDLRGVPAVAAHYSWKATTLQNKLNPDCDRNVLGVRELEGIAALTQDPRILDSLCATMRAIWIPIPSGDNALTMSAMLQKIGEASMQLGQLARDTGESIADGKITRDEFSVMEKTSMGLIQTVQGLMEQARAEMEAREVSRD